MALTRCILVRAPTFILRSCVLKVKCTLGHIRWLDVIDSGTYSTQFVRNNYSKTCVPWVVCSFQRRTLLVNK
ncbi:hypothetical protein PR003_g21884 [Phytophthora rubi]|uniref:Uncharacterized protein n=1 Tax=Phytophthora rubi TaxID=129364 RepID=A0A6A3IW56_9STRA|nr:hypothetical protein PR002_g23193 [Phytophthora rubi]KAE9031342.1 hypothetical protein PR001_g11033 [Phytophthora rubi]KAE9303926.1 hypothetical protein PR003_g21884 [Phytophthora rubi]